MLPVKIHVPALNSNQSAHDVRLCYTQGFWCQFIYVVIIAWCYIMLHTKLLVQNHFVICWIFQFRENAQFIMHFVLKMNAIIFFITRFFMARNAFSFCVKLLFMSQQNNFVEQTPAQLKFARSLALLDGCQ